MVVQIGPVQGSSVLVVPEQQLVRGVGVCQDLGAKHTAIATRDHQRTDTVVVGLDRVTAVLLEHFQETGLAVGGSQVGQCFATPRSNGVVVKLVEEGHNTHTTRE